MASYKIGSSGSAVLKIKQKLYEKKFLTRLPSSTVYDRETAKAVEDFQTKMRIGIDGKVGPITLKKLGLTAEPKQFLHVHRTVVKKSVTLGHLYLNQLSDAHQSWKRIGFTYELGDRGNKPNKSCVPEGSYMLKVRNDVSMDSFDNNRGWRLELINVPKRTVIQIHRASIKITSAGCILPIDMGTFNALKVKANDEKGLEVMERHMVAKNFLGKDGSGGGNALSAVSDGYMKTIKAWYELKQYDAIEPAMVTISKHQPTSCYDKYWNDLQNALQ